MLAKQEHPYLQGRWVLDVECQKLAREGFATGLNRTEVLQLIGRPLSQTPRWTIQYLFH